MTLQFAAEAYEKEHRKEFDLGRLAGTEFPPLARDMDGRMILNTTELVRVIMDQRLAGKSSQELAWYFHVELARQITAACVRARKETGCGTVALSGGVFQNRLLLALTCSLLEREAFCVLTHSLIPPNDGGISLGQAVCAMNQINRKTRNMPDENRNQQGGCEDVCRIICKGSENQ